MEGPSAAEQGEILTTNSRFCVSAFFEPNAPKRSDNSWTCVQHAPLCGFGKICSRDGENASPRGKNLTNWFEVTASDPGRICSGHSSVIFHNIGYRSTQSLLLSKHSSRFITIFVYYYLTVCRCHIRYDSDRCQIGRRSRTATV